MSDLRGLPAACSLDGRRILITGATSGIGRATAVTASLSGAAVVVTGRDRDRLDETFSMLDGSGHVAVIADLSDTDAITNCFELAGPVSDVVQAAGIQSSSPLRSMTDRQIDDLISTNLRAAILVAREFSKRGRRLPTDGSVSFVSSVTAVRGAPGAAVYSASKAALLGLTRSLAVELGRVSVRVNAVLPGYVRTPMLDALGRALTVEQLNNLEKSHVLGFGEPQDVAWTLCYLCSSAARWITGIGLVVDGGYAAG